MRLSRQPRALPRCGSSVAGSVAAVVVVDGGGNGDGRHRTRWKGQALAQ